MATVVETLVWATESAGLKDYLGIVGSGEDTRLEMWFDLAVESADTYLENPFIDDDGNDTTHPVAIKQGVYEYVKALREFYSGSILHGTFQISVKTRDLQENYRDKTANMTALEIAKGYWRPYKLSIHLDGV